MCQGNHCPVEQEYSDTALGAGDEGNGSDKKH